MKKLFFFIVYHRSGVVQFEKGTRPSFLNDFIITMNSENILKKEVNVRDKIVEYEVRGHFIYLSICNTHILQDILKNYNFKENKLNMLDSENIKDKKNMTGIKKFKNKKASTEKLGKGKEKNSLDFSSENVSLKSSYNSLKNIVSFSFSKLQSMTFSLFSGKINLTELEKILNNHLISKNISPAYSKLIIQDVIFRFKQENIEFVTPEKFKEILKKSISKLILIYKEEDLIEKIKNKRDVFTMCFIGPNGVGKRVRH